MSFEKAIQKEKPLIYVFGVILLLFLIDAAFTPTSVASAFKASFAVFFYLILPGYKLLYPLKLDDVERVLLSIPVSAASVPVVSYYLALFGLKVSFANSLASIILIILVAELFIHKKELLRLHL
ncbi:MAG: hypothetical protein ABH829_03150 [archaeon]